MSVTAVHDLSLHDLLLRDWGTDLPIRGGFGGSRDDPIIVDSSDPTCVVETQMLVLRGIGQGRGVFWRCLERNLLGEPWNNIEQLLIETKELTANQLITTKAAYYFDLSALRSKDAVTPLPTLAAYQDESGLVLPFELGWLHFSDSTDHKATNPGLGVTLRYGAPGIKGTVYVYDQGSVRRSCSKPGDRRESIIVERCNFNDLGRLLHPYRTEP